VLPAGPERSERFLDYFFAPGEDEAWIAELLEFDGQVGREDTVLVERVQRGVRSGAVEHGHLLAGSERLVAHFQRRLAAQLGDEP
jgi:choline monooxygenase